MNQNQLSIVPVWIKVLSILYYLIATFFLFYGVVFVLGGTSQNILSETLYFEFPGATKFILIGTFLFVLGIAYFFIGRGLWKGQNWARIAVITFSVLGLILATISLVRGNIISILWLTVNIIIGGYLSFNDKVKVAFSS